MFPLWRNGALKSGLACFRGSQIPSIFNINQQGTKSPGLSSVRDPRSSSALVGLFGIVLPPEMSRCDLDVTLLLFCGTASSSEVPLFLGQLICKVPTLPLHVHVIYRKARYGALCSTLGPKERTQRPLNSFATIALLIKQASLDRPRPPTSPPPNPRPPPTPDACEQLSPQVVT